MPSGMYLAGRKVGISSRTLLEGKTGMEFPEDGGCWKGGTLAVTLPPIMGMVWA